MQHPFNGGNNGGSELFPKQNGLNSQFDNSNKRIRNQEVNINHQMSAPLTSVGQRNNLPVNKVGNGNIFFKTRMCQRFLDGICRNGDGCSFAHGPSDLREPPPNWHELVKDNKGGNGGLHYNDEDRWIQQRGICKKFYYRNECPYGDKCNFSHESPAKFMADAAMDTGRTGESSVMSIQTMVDRGQSQTDAGQRSVNVVNTQDASRASQKTNIWKPGTCVKWETTGQCIFGDKCHFAHGHAGPNTPVGRVDVGGYPCADGSVATNTVHSSFAVPVATDSATDVPVQQHIGRGFLKLANKKINRIYGDWIDDEEDESI